MALLELKNVNVRYIMKDKKVHACQHVSLEIEEQDSIGIVGESGSGKSTLASAVLRLLPHRITQVDGEILYNGKDLLKLTKDEMDALRWTDLSIVFQKSMSALSPVHKVGAQMEDVYRVHFPNADKNEIKQRVYDLFKVVNLSDRVYELYPHELSGGMDAACFDCAESASQSALTGSGRSDHGAGRRYAESDPARNHEPGTESERNPDYDYPRRFRRRLDLQEDRRHVRRPADGKRRDEGRLSQSAAPLHSGPAQIVPVL